MGYSAGGMQATGGKGGGMNRPMYSPQMPTFGGYQQPMFGSQQFGGYRPMGGLQQQFGGYQPMFGQGQMLGAQNLSNYISNMQMGNAMPFNPQPQPTQMAGNLLGSMRNAMPQPAPQPAPQPTQMAGNLLGSMRGAMSAPQQPLQTINPYLTMAQLHNANR